MVCEGGRVVGAVGALLCPGLPPENPNDAAVGALLCPGLPPENPNDAAVGALLRRGAPHTAAWDDASANDGGATMEEAAAMELVHMYVRPSRRRRGYGRALMRAVAAHARATAGVARVVLSAPSVDDEAVAFYEHLGFLWQLRPSGYCARSLHATPSLQVAFYEHLAFLWQLHPGGHPILTRHVISTGRVLRAHGL